MTRIEPSSDFQFPRDRETDLLKDFFRAKYGRGLTADELEFLGNIISDFLAWSQNNCGKNQLRTAAAKCIRLLTAIDELMSSSKDPERTWTEISLGLGLPSVCLRHMTQVELASSRGISPMAVSKSVHKFLRIVNLAPAFTNNHLNF